MNKENLQREVADLIEIDGKVQKLTYIGSGTNCQVYETEEGDIIKEFCPYIAQNPTMSRKESKNGPLSPIESLPEKYKEIRRARLEKFKNEEKKVEELNGIFCLEKNNMFVTPEFILTSLGVCQRYKRTSGKILSDHLNSLRKQEDGSYTPFVKRFAKVIPYIIKLFNQIKIYHEGGVLNLDIKPDNIMVVYFDNYEGLRNIDFGSVMKIDEILSGIVEYAQSHSGLEKEELSLQIASNFFASSVPYYDEERIKNCIKACLKENLKKDVKVKYLKQLDIIAGWKTLLYAMCNDDELWFTETSKKNDSENEMFEKLLYKLFAKEKITESESLFGDYNVFFKLYSMSCKIFQNDVNYFIDSGEICEILGEIYGIINGETPESTERQLKAIDLNKALMDKDEWLKEKGLHTVSDVLQYCDENSRSKGGELSYPSPPESLYLHMLVF